MADKKKAKGKAKKLADLDLDKIAGGVEEECPRGPDTEEERLGVEEESPRGRLPRYKPLGGNDARRRRRR